MGICYDIKSLLLFNIEYHIIKYPVNIFGHESFEINFFTLSSLFILSSLFLDASKFKITKIGETDNAKLESENNKVQGVLKFAGILINVACDSPNDQFPMTTTTESSKTNPITAAHVYQHFQNVYQNCDPK